MTMVNGPNGQARTLSRRCILKAMRCQRLTYGRKGQAIVETALLLPILMLVTIAAADLGRVFYYSIAVTNAAREAARQGTYYDPVTASNLYDSYAEVLAAAQREVPGDVTLSLPTASPAHCLTGQPSSWSSYYPTQGNSGYVFICFDDNDSQSAPAQNSVSVTILYSFQPVTPLSDLVGSDLVHVRVATTMQVESA